MDNETREMVLQQRADMLVNDWTGTPGPTRWYWAAWCAYAQYPNAVSVHQSGRTRTKREAQQQANAAMRRVEAAWKAMLGKERD